jgi:hypothetical protein
MDLYWQTSGCLGYRMDFRSWVLGKVSMTLKVFLSYRREDSGRIAFIKNQLDALAIHKKIDFWWDGKIRTSDDWDEEIKQNVQDADLIIVILSQDYLTSTYIAEREWPFIRARCLTGHAILFPVLYERCNFKILNNDNFHIEERQFWPRPQNKLKAWVELTEDEKAQQIESFIIELFKPYRTIIIRELPPCDWCWWRKLDYLKPQSIVSALADLNLNKKNRIPDLVDALPKRLTELTTFETAKEIIKTTNDILQLFYGENPKKRVFITQEVRSDDMEDSWAGVLTDANQCEPNTLITLFLVLYSEDDIRVLADVNLRNLFKKKHDGGGKK